LPDGIERSRICRKARDYIGHNRHQQAAMEKPAETALGESMLTSQKPSVVLDTNVVLDWLLFREPSVGALAAAVTGARVRWLVTVAMRDEFAHVLGRGLAATRQADMANLLADWDAHAQVLPAPAQHRLRCTDKDDQKFIDLAFAARARWLISRDRAVLRLRGRAAGLGLTVLAPQRWAIGQ
jgi:putative PIN family toxin of toxin-antitoxin system